MIRFLQKTILSELFLFVVIPVSAFILMLFYRDYRILFSGIYLVWWLTLTKMLSHWKCDTSKIGKKGYTTL